MKKVIFVGWVRTGKSPVDGETAKNQAIIAELKKHCTVTVLDFYEKHRHPWIYLQALWAFIRRPKATIIFSTSAKNVYDVLKLFKKMGLRRDIIHWVIGGAFGQYVKSGRYRADVFGYAKYTLVESHVMVHQLTECGMNNVRRVPNFKAVSYCPDLEKALVLRRKSEKTRFVFLSRIMPGKGCDYLLEAVRQLNEKGQQDLFIVDFYGKIDESYKETFTRKVNLLDNVNYHGLLDLRTKEGYDTLATYHAMAFPTFHPTEGFAGVFIDAFIAGLPVLASDWAYNPEIIRHGELGWLFPAHQAEAIVNTLEHYICRRDELDAMALNARKEMSVYKAENVLSESFLKSIGLIL